MDTSFASKFDRRRRVCLAADDAAKLDSSVSASAQGVHVLVYFHANAEDLGASHQHVLSLQVWLKVHAVCVEYPGYGLSVGTPTEKTVRDDSCSVIRFLINVMGVPVSRIVLMGRSIGSAVAAKLAKDFDVGGLILISPFTRIVDVAEQMVGRLSSAIFDDTFFDTLSIMSEIHCRTLFFHGTEDKLAPLWHSEKLYAHCVAESGTGKMLHLCTGLGHNDIDLVADVQPVILHFFQLWAGEPLKLKIPVDFFATMLTTEMCKGSPLRNASVIVSGVMNIFR
eukprot:GEMP01062795.1.p1 GENE.GEMP01062795.1~~GEMP01062795.1.p1  ORF type:complete len:281 (+),score=69.59 GEMP01062795.1:137-979(+)